MNSFEMILFGCFHMKAFAVKPYIANSTTGGIIKTAFLKSLLHAFNFRDWARETKDSSLHVALTIKGAHRPLEVERQTDLFVALSTARPRSQPAEAMLSLDSDLEKQSRQVGQDHTVDPEEEEGRALLALQEAESRALRESSIPMEHSNVQDRPDRLHSGKRPAGFVFEEL